ncbi:MAG TPA: hypothetical protein VKB86_06455 [Pyrinomonadaceae bacterium]|nr:hypothetical protein [Pyrinomonadaceae bacterium]
MKHNSILRNFVIWFIAIIPVALVGFLVLDFQHLTSEDRVAEEWRFATVIFLSAVTSLNIICLLSQLKDGHPNLAKALPILFTLGALLSIPSGPWLHPQFDYRNVISFFFWSSLLGSVLNIISFLYRRDSPFK